MYCNLEHWRLNYLYEVLNAEYRCSKMQSYKPI